jgi:hypothetical protein
MEIHTPVRRDREVRRLERKQPAPHDADAFDVEGGTESLDGDRALTVGERSCTASVTVFP